MTQTLEKLNYRKAVKEDWARILKLLDETELTYWFTGEESFENFFIVFHKETNELISCFAIYQKENIGLLKQVATSKSSQGKGIGTYVANKIIPDACEQIGVKRLYLQGGNKKPFTSLNFWKKTEFKQIDKDEISDKYAKEYFDSLEKAFAEHFFREATFYIEV